VKLTKNQLKELIRQSIREIDFKDQESFKKYQSKHKMRPSTKVSIGGKDTTVGDAGKKDDEPTTGGPSYANVPKGVKTSKDAKAAADELPDDDWDPDADDDYMLEPGMSPDDDEAEYTGGPSYADVPKGAKTSQQAKDMSKEKPSPLKNVSIKDLKTTDPYDDDGNYLGSDDYDPDDAWDPPNVKGITNKTDSTVLKQKYIDLNQHVRQMEQQIELAQDDGNKEDEEDGQRNWKKAKAIQNNIVKALKSQKSPGGMMGTLGAREKGQGGSGMYDSYNPKRKVREEKLTEGRKCTVKEVKKWMRGLEENRYKKTYNSDARRVSWLVNNNLSEDYDTMPVSMKKKWPKAQYGRERHLANEYIKHIQEKELSESKLTSLIRDIIKEVKNGKKN